MNYNKKNEKEKKGLPCLLLLKIKCERRSMFELEHLHRARMGEIRSKRTNKSNNSIRQWGRVAIALGNSKE
jgi:hypothetical protein